MMPSATRLPSVVQRHPLATYFGLTFAISWAVWLVLILGSLHIQTPSRLGPERGRDRRP